MSKQYKIIYRKSQCIGAGACEFAAPELWHYDKEKSIATLKDVQTVKTDEVEELIIEESALARHLEAAQVCPVNIIEIYDLETGQKIHP
ncbi:ferredoxin [Candidatus Woesearchaeota archaeon]|nr:ferredoxin [Candidatus Woesearchaeota archaeon]